MTPTTETTEAEDRHHAQVEDGPSTAPRVAAWPSQSQPEGVSQSILEVSSDDWYNIIQ